MPPRLHPLAAGLASLIALVPTAAALPADGYGSSAAAARAVPAVEGNRGPLEIAFTPDGAFACVTEHDEGTVAIIDAESRSVLARVPTGGERPAGLAVTPDGQRLLVCNSYGGSLALISLTGRRRQKLLPLPGMPWGVAIHPDGGRAYVTVSQLDEVAVVDLKSFEVTGAIPVGRRPRSLALTPDGATLVVVAMQGASMSIIDTTDQREAARVPLKGPNARGIAIPADAVDAYTTVMPAFNGKVTNESRQIWHNLVQACKLDGSSSAPAEDQWLDFARVPGTIDVIGSPDGQDIEVDAEGAHAWISVGGRDVVTRITVRDRRRNAVWPISQIETPVGANPRGLALRPRKGELWVANHLGNSLSVIDPAECRVTATVGLGPASRKDPSIAGRYLFNNAGMTAFQRFTCNSCHPDGASDGLTWRFIHVPDQLRERNTRDLRADVASTSPFRWSGHEKTLDEFVRSEVTGLLFGPEPGEERTRLLQEAVASFRLPPNPFRTRDGSLTPAATRGRSLFEGRAGCVSCHAGPLRGGTGLRADVGTFPGGLKLDVPHLTGAYDSAPYLHDGSAATLRDVLTSRNRARRHGFAHQLTDEEREDLVRYIREL